MRRALARKIDINLSMTTQLISPVLFLLLGPISCVHAVCICNYMYSHLLMNFLQYNPSYGLLFHNIRGKEPLSDIHVWVY